MSLFESNVQTSSGVPSSGTTTIPMLTNQPIVIRDNNLARAWASIFLPVLRSGRTSGPPSLITLDVDSAAGPNEDSFLRATLEAHLQKCGKVSIEDNAAMIFPYHPWVHLKKPSRDALYAFYRRMETRANRRTTRNHYGTYFSRMIAYSGLRGETPHTVNQIEHILGRWNHRKTKATRPRASELQIACFDPAKDHTGQALRGFPCLQQVSLAYEGDKLALSAYYPTQYIFDRGYGNYLGLYRLGLFLAHEMGLTLSRVCFFIGSPRLGDNVRKQALSDLRKVAESVTAGIAT
jgi:hypothetical protein